MLRLNEKNFQPEELPHELFLTTRQITKISNAFDKNISTDIKLSKDQISIFSRNCDSIINNDKISRSKVKLTNT